MKENVGKEDHDDEEEERIYYLVVFINVAALATNDWSVCVLHPAVTGCERRRCRGNTVPHAAWLKVVSFL